MNDKITFSSFIKPSIKNYLSLRLFLLFFLILNISALAEIRYVSRTGSSTPPYTSWVTAADSIQKCIDFSQSGDTIYIGPGTYVETLVVAEGIALIGSGIDSTIIDSRTIAYFAMWTIALSDSNIIMNLQVRADNNNNGIAIAGGFTTNNFSIVENCYLRDASIGVALSFTSSIFRGNMIENCDTGINFAGFQNDTPLIKNNIIYMGDGTTEGIRQDGGGNPIINNNTIIISNPGAYGTLTIMRATEVKNNLMVSRVDAGRGFHFTIGNHPVENNVAIGNYNRNAMFFFRGTHIVRNNMVLNGTKGIHMDEQFTINYKYNNVWNVDIPYFNFAPDSTNLSVEPMVVSEDSLDFHLQKYSPLIDAGDPNILDIDGSRSDIGLYGGPNGELYFYEDLAPKPPVNLNGEIDSNVVSITWNKNHETDFSHYNIYRETSPGFDIGSNNLIATTEDTLFNDQWSNSKNLYYKITSVDSTGNESQPSEELTIVVVGVETAEVKVKDYLLYQNYPNPFNPTTTIGYRIKESGFVRLTVYDVKGEKVAQLENGNKSAGYHEVKFMGRGVQGKTLSEQISSGLYIYRLEVRNENNVPVFIDSGKMMMVK